MITEQQLIIAAAGFILTILAVAIAGAMRRSKISNTYKDPNQKVVSDTLNQVIELKKQNWPDYKKNKDNLINTVMKRIESLKELQKQDASRTKEEVSLFEFDAFMNYEKLERITLSLARYDVVTAHINSLQNALPTFSDDQKIKHDHYYIHDLTYNKITQQKEQWESAENQYDRVLSQVREAKSSVSDAQMMETFDLVSKNKGISLMSTLSNSDAGNEIDDIKPELDLLKTQLRILKEDTPDAMKTIKVSDTLDLVSDFVFDFSFDFMSVFSLMKLSKADDQLDDLAANLLPLGKHLKENTSKFEDLRSKYLLNLA